MIVASCVGFTAAAQAVTMEIIAGVDKGFWLKSLEVLNTSAAITQGQLRRTVTKGVTPTTIPPVEFMPLGASSGPSLSIQARFAVAWGTPPVVTGSGVIWPVNMPATVGLIAFKDFTLRNSAPGVGRGIYVPAGASISWQSTVATGAPLITAIIEE